MGMEFQVDSLEEMCSLMCDNVIPHKNPKKKTEKWIFTFGSGQLHEGHYVAIEGSFSEARTKMVDMFGDNWGFQYSEDEWEEMENDPNRWWPLETPLEV